MKSYCIYIVLMLLLVSCSNQESKIKEALESSIPVDLVHSYELKEYMILETILDVNLKDSITKYLSKSIVNEAMIQSDSLRLKPILKNMNDCKVQRANTLYYLRSTYDGLIRDYEKMRDDIIQKIKEKENENIILKNKIEQLEDILKSSTSPIIYYKVKHVYNLQGMRKEEIVTLDVNYKFINSEL